MRDSRGFLCAHPSLCGLLAEELAGHIYLTFIPLSQGGDPSGTLSEGEQSWTQPSCRAGAGEVLHCSALQLCLALVSSLVLSGT